MTTPDASSLTILIVDDNEELRSMLGEVLERMGHQVQSTDKAKDALSTMERVNIDLVLLDLKMPGVSGFGLLKLMRRRQLPVPVIVVSAHISQDVVKELAEVGIEGMLAKPFKKDRMKEEIERVRKAYLSG